MLLHAGLFASLLCGFSFILRFFPISFHFWSRHCKQSMLSGLGQSCNFSGLAFFSVSWGLAKNVGQEDSSAGFAQFFSRYWMPGVLTSQI